MGARITRVEAQTIGETCKHDERPELWDDSVFLMH